MRRLGAALWVLSVLTAMSGSMRGQSEQGTSFTYQGQLKKDGSPYSGNCDLRFSLNTLEVGGSQVGSALDRLAVGLSNGFFTVRLDFGALFRGLEKWLEIQSRCPAGSGSYTTLSPRQEMSATPYALALPALHTEPNATCPNVIGGWNANNAAPGVAGATISGGGQSGIPNRVTDNFGTVGGGLSNRAGDDSGLTTSASHATVGGGTFNTASGYGSTIGGGTTNTASEWGSTIGGGTQNTASGQVATISGGTDHTASGNYAAIPGGQKNSATGAYSFAAGRRAAALFDGSFVLSDSTDNDVFSNGLNTFVARFAGGAWFYSNAAASTGVRLSAGSGSWASLSDRRFKANLEAVDTRSLLERVAMLPISTWSYTSQDSSIRHIGPTAQDFHAAFRVGEDDRQISVVDADGVALAAIQGLYGYVKELEKRVESKDTRIDSLERQLKALKDFQDMAEWRARMISRTELNRALNGDRSMDRRFDFGYAPP